MGRQTHYLGHISIDPPLTAEEAAHIAPSGRDGPAGWSNWRACAHGCCLGYDEGDKANHMIPWLEHLMETHLQTHRLNGTVVGSRLDTGELFAIHVRENVMTTELLWPGNNDWTYYPEKTHSTAWDVERSWPAGVPAPFDSGSASLLRAPDEPEN